MKECYICAREGITKCSSCKQIICRVHAEDDKIKSSELTNICTSCKRKRKFSRIRIITIVSALIFIFAIALWLILSSLYVWS